MRTSCCRCSDELRTEGGDDWAAGYCGACIGYLSGIVAENLAQYGGFTEEEWRDYADDRYSMKPPDVCTAMWDHASWMAYIFGPRS